MMSAESEFYCVEVGDTVKIRCAHGRCIKKVKKVDGKWIGFYCSCYDQDMVQPVSSCDKIEGER